MTRVLLFDWTAGGHHARYARAFADALAPTHEVVVALPDALLGAVADLPVEPIGLGAARPALDVTRPLAPQHAMLAREELARLEAVLARSAAEHVVHLYADPVLRRVVERPPLAAAVSLVVFFARAHYPSAYGSPLPPRELARAWFQELLLARWSRRRDAHALLLLDEEAARRWRGRGVRAVWLPEPPLGAEAPPVIAREGCALYGALARRKGIDRLARAVAAREVPLRVTLAGAVEAGFAEELAALRDSMVAAGADVRLHGHEHDEAAGLAVLAAARCAVLPYVRHYGMSRVLLEACGAGTPVLAHDFGLLGALVRRHALGEVVNCADPAAFAVALGRLVDDAAAPHRHAPALAAFARRYAPAVFTAALHDALATPGGTRDPVAPARRGWRAMAGAEATRSQP